MLNVRKQWTFASISKGSFNDSFNFIYYMNKVLLPHPVLIPLINGKQKKFKAMHFLLSLSFETKVILILLLPVFQSEAIFSDILASGGSKGGAPPHGQNFLNFMQFLRKI